MIIFTSFSFFDNNNFWDLEWPIDTFYVLYQKEQLSLIENLRKKVNLFVFLTNRMKNNILNDERINNYFKQVLQFKQIETALNYTFFSQVPLRWNFLSSSKQDFNVEEFYICKNCGAVLFPGESKNSCCRGYPQIKDAVDIGPPPSDVINIFLKNKDKVPNYARIINYQLRPVIQNAKIHSPNATHSTIFVTGLPYAYDG